jgi:hypothetical protein
VASTVSPHLTSHSRFYYYYCCCYSGDFDEHLYGVVDWFGDDLLPVCSVWWLLLWLVLLLLVGFVVFSCLVLCVVVVVVDHSLAELLCLLLWFCFVFDFFL